MRFKHVPSRPVRLAIIAILVASAGAALADRCKRRRPPGGAFSLSEGLGPGTMSINSMLDLPVTNPEMEPWPEALADPEIRCFLDAAVRHAKTFMGDSSADYDVWLVIPKRTARGWPFDSYAEAALVFVEEYPASGGRAQYFSFVDSTGASPMRWWGLFGNWLFYLAVSIPLIWFADVRLCSLHRRFRRPPRAGFPVIPLDDHDQET